MIGEVTGAEKKSAYAGDQYFPAGEYDFVFDVQLGDDDIPENRARLPFNKDGNPMVAAEKFIARQKIDRGHMQQIRDFIRSNAGLNQTSAAPKPAAAKPAAAKPAGYPAAGAAPGAKSKHFLNEAGVISFKTGKPDMMSTKMLEFNATLGPAADKDQDPLPRLSNVEETEYFPGLVAKLGKNAEFRQVEKDLLWERMRGDWPVKDGFFVVVDMMRMYILSRESTDLFKGMDKGAKYLATSDRCAKTFLLGEGLPEGERDGPLRLVTARFLANLSEQPTNRFACLRLMQPLCEAISQVADTKNKNTRSALGAVMINFGIQFSDNISKATKPSDPAQEAFFNACAALTNAAAAAGDAEVVYACLVAVGSATSHHNVPNMTQKAKKFLETDAKASIAKSCASGKNAEVLRDLHALIAR